ncbi:MAG: hypothetical protein WEA35_08765, partial [Candidatus Nanopelagicales bacterium]
EPGARQVPLRQEQTSPASPGPVDTAIPTPTAAAGVSATRYGSVSGKAKGTWTQSDQRYPTGYTLYFRLITSNDRCTYTKNYEMGGTCLNSKSGVTWACKIKRLPSGNTEFQVALWHQDFSGADGPIAYSTWSNTVNVK